MQTSISKKFSRILKEKLGLTKEEMEWFKEKTPNGIEQFVFRGDNRTPKCLWDILEILGERTEALTPSEEYSVLECFAIILPYPVFEDDDKTWRDMYDKRAYRIEQAVHYLYIKSWEDNYYIKRLFVSISEREEPRADRRRDFYICQYQMIKSWNEKWSFIMDKAIGIRKAERIDCMWMCEKCGIAGISKESREQFCETGKTENEVIKKAYNEMRKISYNDLYEYLISLLITTYQEDEKYENVNIDVQNKEGCMDACRNLFCEIIAHELRNSSINDFKYMIKEAMKELEIIRKVLGQGERARNRRKKSLYPAVDICACEKYLSKKGNYKIKNGIRGDCEIEGLHNLSNIRRYLNKVENEKILVTDLLSSL
ncbi:MAG: hypothetical protein HDR09_07400 [Lachnospiraceae bacterium]|nr:hypothetical protein [Lachnospiraceae bacterium]